MAVGFTTIGTDEHTLVVGMTGSGKSYFCETYLKGYPHVIKLDTKGEYFERKKAGLNAWAGLEEGKDFVMVEHITELAQVTTPKIIYCPDFEEQEPEYYDEFFRFCYMRENTIIWVDELMSISTASFYPKWLRACMTRGRSKNVSVWACTQRPLDIPSIVPSNTTHFICYDLMLEQDRKKMSDITGAPEFRNRPKGKYHFWYFKNKGMNNALLCVLR